MGRVMSVLPVQQQSRRLIKGVKKRKRKDVRIWQSAFLARWKSRFLACYL